MEEEREFTAERVIALLKEKKLEFSSAESCTGGLLMAALTNVPGASEVIKEGVITYADEAKVKYLGVSERTLARFGAVSEETAREMAEGLQKKTGAAVTASVTGFAGPGGGTSENPVGTVYIACRYNGATQAERLALSGNRAEIREDSVKRALALIGRRLLG